MRQRLRRLVFVQPLRGQDHVVADSQGFALARNAVEGGGKRVVVTPHAFRFVTAGITKRGEIFRQHVLGIHQFHADRGPALLELTGGFDDGFLAANHCGEHRSQGRDPSGAGSAGSFTPRVAQLLENGLLGQ